MIYMKKFLFTLLLLGMVPALQARDFKWQRTVMDGSRTGVTTPTAVNVPEALGKVGKCTYTAPNGRKFWSGVTPKVASLLIGAQPQIAFVKEVVGYAPEAMLLEAPECALSDWYIDELMRACAARSGKNVDIGIVNFGGIRVDMPQGDVLMDDILSMFPFKNYLCYLEIKGADIRKLLQQLAATSWQVVGGARCVVKDGKLVSAEIGGKPLDDKKVYGVCTISFLLSGGDGISVARNALYLEEFKDTNIIDVILPYVRQLAAEGKPIQYQTDGRIIIEN